MDLLEHEVGSTGAGGIESTGAGGIRSAGGSGSAGGGTGSAGGGTGSAGGGTGSAGGGSGVGGCGFAGGGGEGSRSILTSVAMLFSTSLLSGRINLQRKSSLYIGEERINFDRFT